MRSQLIELRVLISMAMASATTRTMTSMVIQCLTALMPSRTIHLRLWTLTVMASAITATKMTIMTVYRMQAMLLHVETAISMTTAMASSTKMISIVMEMVSLTSLTHSSREMFHL